jgi:hypothetical protein
MSEPKFTIDDVAVLKQIPQLCPHVEMGGSTEAFKNFIDDLAMRVAELAPKPFNPFEFKCEGVGEVIQPDDPRHPKYEQST